MNLIDIYIQEVTRRLPEKSRADIALELQSIIADMLPDDYTEEDVESVLSKLGNPAVLANGYRDRPMHLIGPRYFDAYTMLLKLILPIAMISYFIVQVVINITTYSGEAALVDILITIFTEIIWVTSYIGIHTFFWITVIFAIAERMDKGSNQVPLTTHLKEWTPKDLKRIPYIPKQKKISTCEVFGGLLWTAIWAMVYFNANYLIGVYEKGQHGLRFVMPALNQDVLLSYWPFIILVIGLEVGVAIYKLVIKHWTKKLAVMNMIFHVVSSIVFIVVLMNPDLFHAEFIHHITDLFGITFELKNNIIRLAVSVFVIFAAIDSYQGFKKAKIKTQYPNLM